MKRNYSFWADFQKNIKHWVRLIWGFAVILILLFIGIAIVQLFFLPTVIVLSGLVGFFAGAAVVLLYPPPVLASLQEIIEGQEVIQALITEQKQTQSQTDYYSAEFDVKTGCYPILAFEFNPDALENRPFLALCRQPDGENEFFVDIDSRRRELVFSPDIRQACAFKEIENLEKIVAWGFSQSRAQKRPIRIEIINQPALASAEQHQS